MRKLMLGLGLCLCLLLAACGPGAISPTPAPTPTPLPAPPPTRNPQALPTISAAPLATATSAPPTPAPATATSAPPEATPTTPALTPTAPALTASPTPGPLTHVVLNMGYVPDVQFAPYYVAQDKGFYAAEGLEVELKYGSAPDVLAQVGSGEGYNFVVTSGDEMVPARVNGIPVVYIMAQYQKYPVGAAAVVTNGITLKSPADLKGRTVGIPGAYGSSLVALKALLKAGNLTDSDITLNTIGFTQVEALSRQQVQVAITYLMNEPVQLQALGNEVQTLSVSDYFNLISVGVSTSERTIKEHPDLVQHFVAATQRGLADALAHPDDAFASSSKRIPEITGDKLILQRKVLDATMTFEQPPAGHPLGWSDPAGWQATQDLLKAVGIIEQTADVSGMYTNQFVEQATP